jgi:hypothetical protein
MVWPAAALERAARPLDQARRALLVAAMRVPPLAAVVARRDARVLVRSMVGIAVAFTASVVFPAWFFVLSPLVLGVPHVGADVRYLVRRQGMSRGTEAFFYVGCVALLGLRAAELAAPAALPYARTELAVAAAWVVSAAFLSARAAGERWRAALLAAAAGALLAVAWPRPDLARVVFAHAHNLIAVALWLALFYRRRFAVVPVALLGLAVLLIVSGATLPWVVRFSGYKALGVDVFYAADQLAPRVAGALGPALVLSYVFLQSVHYMAWLTWIPDSATRGQGTPTFRMTARGLARELGGPWLALLVAAALAVALAALLDASRTRAVYLSLAAFHGYLELAAVAYLATRAARPAVAGRGA